MLARELETGTFRYAWTQGIGRLRWTIAKLTLLAVVIAILAWAFSQLFAWFFDPFLGFEGMNVLAATVFTTRGSRSPPGRSWPSPSARSSACSSAGSSRPWPPPSAPTSASSLLAWLVLREDYPVAINTTNASLFNGPSTPNSPWILQDVDSRRHELVALHPGQPVLAHAVHRGRLAAAPRDSPGRGDGLAGPPPGRLGRAPDGDKQMTVRSMPVKPGRDAGRPDGRPCRGRECSGSPGGSTVAC